MTKNVPKAGGHRKPGAAARHAPDGSTHTTACPTCKGKGTVATDDAPTLRKMLLKRV